MNILEELYKWYETRRMDCSPERGEAQKRFNEVWARAEKVLGEELGEELRNGIFAYMDDACANDFRTGFRLGALLIQELHTP